MSTENKFIEVTRITFNRESQKNVLLLETYNIGDIKSFRRWFKNEKQKDVEGDITMLIVGSPEISSREEDFSNEKVEVKQEKSFRQVLIKESYNSFSVRINNISQITK